MKNLTIDKEVLKYVSREDYLEVYNSLKDKEYKILYQADKIRISLAKRGKRIFTVKTHYGNMPIEEVVKNMMLIQAQL